MKATRLFPASLPIYDKHIWKKSNALLTMYMVALAFGILIFMTPTAFAGKPIPSTGPIPYHSSTGESFDSSYGTIYFDPVPDGKRLVVEYVSVFFETYGPLPEWAFGVNCRIWGTDTDGLESRLHYIVLQEYSDGILDTSGWAHTKYTGAGPIRMYLEAGRVYMLCDTYFSPTQAILIRGNVSGYLEDSP